MYTACFLIMYNIWGLQKGGRGLQISQIPPLQFLPGSTIELSRVPNGFVSIRTFCNQIKQL